MANTLTIKGFNKVLTPIFNKVANGKELTDKQRTILNNYIKDMGGYREQEQAEQIPMDLMEEINSLPEQPQEDPQPTQEDPQPTQEETQELTLESWETLTEDQKKELKETLLKSKYGRGGEHGSIIPTLMDKKDNPFIQEAYGTIKNYNQNKFNTLQENGELKIIPLEIGNTINYLITLLPNKELSMDIWELLNGETKPYTKYTHHNKVGQITLSEKEYIITNIYTNKNKAWGQQKQLSTLLGTYTNIKEGEAIKDLKPNNYYLRKDIKDGNIIYKEISTNTHKPTGNTFNTIGEYLQREYPTNKVGRDILDQII